MMRFEPVGRLRHREGWLLHEHFSALADWPTSFQLPSPHFVLFLALDARTLDAQTMGALAERLLDNGLAYLVAWGPDCGRVHDTVDAHIVHRDVARHIPSVGFVTTTWHSRESLADAFEFFALSANTDDEPWECSTWLAVTIGERAWADEFRRLLPEFAEPE